MQTCCHNSYSPLRASSHHVLSTHAVTSASLFFTLISLVMNSLQPCAEFNSRARISPRSSDHSYLTALALVDTAENSNPLTTTWWPSPFAARCTRNPFADENNRGRYVLIPKEQRLCRETDSALYKNTGPVMMPGCFRSYIWRFCVTA